MNILIILAVLSLSGASYMLLKKVREIAPHVEAVGVEAHTNFIVDFVIETRDKAIAVSREMYISTKPHIHDFISVVASRLYKISSWFAHESLKIHNFIQGKRVLKNSGNTSIFIRDIAVSKRGSRKPL